MKPAAFDYVVADSVDAACAALGRGDAKIIAGGQSLVPMLNFRLLRPAILVDINRIPGLDFICEDDTAITVGALTRHHQLETSPVIARHLPVLSEAMRHVAHLAIRNRGTIGGSLSHADPAAELPMMAMLLDAAAARRLGVGNADGRGARFLPGCAVRRPRRGRDRHRDRAAEASAEHRLGFRGGRAPQRRFRARRRRRDADAVRRRGRAGPYRRDRRRAHAATCRRGGGRC